VLTNLVTYLLFHCTNLYGKLSDKRSVTSSRRDATHSRRDRGLQMKKYLPSIVLCLFFLFPAISCASYVIMLKNGGQFVTSQYWEEEDEIKFYIGDAAMGIEKDAVLDIKKSAKKPEGMRYEAEKPERCPAEAEPKPAVSGTPKADEKTTAKEKVAEDSNKDKDIIQELERLQKKSESRANMTVDELEELMNDLKALENIIFSRYPQGEHQGEIDRIAELEFFILDTIKRKSLKR